MIFTITISNAVSVPTFHKALKASKYETFLYSPGRWRENVPRMRTKLKRQLVRRTIGAPDWLEELLKIILPRAVS